MSAAAFMSLRQSLSFGLHKRLLPTCAASEAPSTAIPQSDFFNEGASFTPSPEKDLARIQSTACVGHKRDEVHTSHSGQMSTLLKHFHDLILMFREHFSEAIRALH